MFCNAFVRSLPIEISVTLEMRLVHDLFDHFFVEMLEHGRFPEVRLEATITVELVDVLAEALMPLSDVTDALPAHFQQF